MVVVLLVAATLRLAAFGQLPPGLYHDEAQNGLDALDVLDGQLSFYFAANNGREPLFIYLIALAVAICGQSPFALRLVSFFVGMLTVAATAALGQALFSRRVGLLAAAVLAMTLWHVHLSRAGFRAVMLPLFIALALWQAALGVRGTREQGSKCWLHWVAAGVLYGLSFYTYTAARLTPLALLGMGGYFVVRRIASRRSGIRNSNLEFAISNVPFALYSLVLILLPLGVYTLLHPDVVLGRPGQVSILDPAINGGDFWRTLGEHTLRTLGMFFVRGDRIWRHNVPWRPVFDPLLGVAFVLGLLVALRRAWRESAAALLLIWTVVMLLPTLLAEDAPHFLRAVGVLPLAVFFPAIGLDAALTALRRRLEPRLLALLPALVLLFGLGSTAWAYFGFYARQPLAGYWFESGATTLAGQINGFLGLGWDGERMVRGGPSDRQVVLDPLLWNDWPQVRFLVAAPQAVTVGLDGPPADRLSPTAVLIWPYADWQRAWALLPAPAEIAVEEGALSQGDRDAEPHVTYLDFTALPVEPAEATLARFEGGIELLTVTTAVQAEGALGVRLRWRVTAPLAEDYTVFVHYMRDGQRIAQGDSRPAGGRYPTTVWRVGDVVCDDHVVAGVGAPIPGRDSLLFGFWQPDSGRNLSLLDEAGNPAGIWMVVEVDG